MTLRRVGFAAFFLLGWTILLVPALIRDIESAFGQTDGGMGLAYLAYNVLYVIGTVAVGLLAVRVERRRLLAAGAAMIGAGCLVCAAAPGFAVFVVGFVLVGMGAGIVDSGVNALFMDLYPEERAAALNRLHLWVAIGALAGPFVVGRVVAFGLDWRLVLVGTAIAAVAVAMALATRHMPPAGGHATATPGGRARALPLPRHALVPLVALAVGLGCYIATEIGVTSWLVRFLVDADVALATAALSLFWGGLALGRLLASVAGHRVRPVVLASVAAAACGTAVLLAVLVPMLPLRIVLFAVAGFAAGPIYPTIMAMGGGYYPSRTSLVSSVLAASGVMGSIVYPPLMGAVSDAIGLPVGMAGAGLLAIVAALAVALAAARAGVARAPVPRS